MYTKGALVDMAYGELALAGYVFDLSPDERQDAGARLEAMVANWLADVSLPFAFSADPANVDLDADSGVPLTHARTVYTGLALDLAASNGKQVHPSTQKAFGEGWTRLLRAGAFPPPTQLPNTLPVGAGNKRWRLNRNPFFPSPDTGPLQVDETGGLKLES